jgi:hypothetical protein
MYTAVLSLGDQIRFNLQRDILCDDSSFHFKNLNLMISENN